MKFKRAIAQSELVWLQAGHVPHWKQPKTVAAHILKFISSTKLP